MNCNPTLTAEEFRSIHNALWELDSVTRQLQSVLKPEIYDKLVLAGSTIRTGLAGAYEQDDLAFERRNRHYGEVKAALGLRFSDWSISTVANLSEPHPHGEIHSVVYRNHWGSKPVTAGVNGHTWAALWVAADACIRDSGDVHHRFIEDFERDVDNPHVMVLTTGS